MEISIIPNKTIYIFKQYGTHECYAFSYHEIINNKNILFSINPVDMIDVHQHEFFAKLRSTECHISEQLPNNTYKLIAEDRYYTCTGEYIINNMDMFENLSHHDLAKIAHETGFRKGRKLSKDITWAILNKKSHSAAKPRLRIVHLNETKD